MQASSPSDNPYETEIAAFNPRQKLLAAKLSLRRYKASAEADLNGKDVLEEAVLDAAAAAKSAPDGTRVVLESHRGRLIAAFGAFDSKHASVPKSNTNDLRGEKASQEEELEEEYVAFLPSRNWEPGMDADMPDGNEDSGDTALAEPNTARPGENASDWTAFEAERLEQAIQMVAAEVALRIAEDVLPRIADGENAVQLAKEVSLRRLGSAEGRQLCADAFKAANSQGLPFFEQTTPPYLAWRTGNLLDATFTYLNVDPR